MTKDEALKLALEVLKSQIVWFSTDTMIGKSMRQKTEKAITALEEALAQTELCKYGQEPKSCTSNPMDCQCAIDVALAQTQEPVCPDCKAKVLYECVACSSNNYPPKTKQETVGYWKEHAQGMQRDYDSLLADYEKLAQPEQEPVAWISPKGHIHFDPYLDSVPLYTHPPQRTWVGLTEDERQEIALEVPIDAVSITEAKLKEKNT